MSRELIRQSWERSKQYNVDVTQPMIPMVSEEELAKRQEAAAHLIAIVDTFIIPLQKVLKDREYTLGFLGADGMILKVYHSQEGFADDYREGKIWLERYTGTTAAGVALATEKVAVVDVEEHWCDKFKTVIAIGHPIFLYGELQGVLTMAIGVRDGLDYLVNLISVVAGKVEEQLMLQDSFSRNTGEVKTLEEVLRTFIHEIKNPLTNIRAFMQLQQIKSGKKAEFDKMILEVDRISEMIQNFRYFSIDKDFFFTRINLAELLTNLRETLNDMFDLKGWQLILHLEENCYVIGNENKLKQVLMNVIKNAYEAIDEDGCVEIWLEKGDKECTVKIIDNGEGIGADEIELIFQPFYTTKSMGYGLGLALCREIVARHKGEIRVVSEKNAGTTVTIALPCPQMVQVMEEEELVSVAR